MNRLRIGLALAGFLLALLSVAFDHSQLGWAAIAFLAASAILRIIQRKRVNGKADRDL